MFTDVSYKDLGNIPAQVNRQTGELFLNPKIWSSLPEEQKEYVLLHEHGHLELMTDNEYQVNKHAIGKYLKRGEVSDSEFERRMVVLSEVLSDDSRAMNPDANLSNTDNSTSAVGLIGGAISSISENLAILGIGSKSRQEEQDKALQSQKEKQSANQKMLIIGGVILIAIVVLVMIFKS